MLSSLLVSVHGLELHISQALSNVCLTKVKYNIKKTVKVQEIKGYSYYMNKQLNGMRRYVIKTMKITHA